MKKENPDGLMSLAAYARHRQCNRSHISRLAAAGVLVLRTTPAGRRLVDVSRSDAILNDVPVDVGEEPPRPEVPGQQPRTSFAEAKLVLAVYQAKLARLDFEEKEGRLVERDAVRQRIAGHISAIRDGLDGLADRLAGPIAAQGDAKKVHALMTAEIRAELVRIAGVIGGRQEQGGEDDRKTHDVPVP